MKCSLAQTDISLRQSPTYSDFLLNLQHTGNSFTELSEKIKINSTNIHIIIEDGKRFYMELMI